MNAVTKKEPTQAETPERQWASRNGGYLVPYVNIIENKEAYILEAEMPGVNKEGLDVLLEGNELTLVGKRQAAEPEAELVYRESSPRDYRRTFVLDPSIDTTKIDARMENGVLRLNLPKAESVKPRKISIS